MGLVRTMALEVLKARQPNLLAQLKLSGSLKHVLDELEANGSDLYAQTMSGAAKRNPLPKSYPLRVQRLNNDASMAREIVMADLAEVVDVLAKPISMPSSTPRSSASSRPSPNPSPSGRSQTKRLTPRPSSPSPSD